MNNEVFNRKELKYIINTKQYHMILDIINKDMVLDNNNLNNKPYTIYNLYFDTINNDYIRESILKPNYKEKIRLRSYHNFNDNKICYLEIKKKYNHHTNKRRTKITYLDSINFISNNNINIKDYMNKQVIKELSYLINKDKLYPKVLIKYDRLAYHSIDNDLRITFDHNIISNRDNKEYQLLDNDLYILEIKYNQGIPLILSNILANNKIYKTSYSKYGKEYERYLKKEGN